MKKKETKLQELERRIADLEKIKLGNISSVHGHQCISDGLMYLSYTP